MATNKTTETSVSVIDFLNTVQDEQKRNDCFSLIDLIQTQTGLTPKLWGPSIIGFGSHHYTYESGREGDSPNVAFSPRASSIVLYLSGSFENRDTLLTQLGKHKTDKGCIHIKSLAAINREVLSQMIANHIRHITTLYPA